MKEGDILNIVVPMAGAGTRFSRAGFGLPKPLISVHGIPMIKVVIDNIKPSMMHRFIFICQKLHIEKYQIDKYLQQIEPSSIVVQVDGLTDGAACTVLLAKKYINNISPLMIANCDQFINFEINKYLDSLFDCNIDGLIMTMKSNDPKWSFVAIENSLVQEVAEKKVISDEATVGIYNFKRGSDFVSSAEKMIFEKNKVNNEYYVAPTYNYLISENKKIGYFNIGTAETGMFGLGIPEDLDFFLNHQISDRIKASK